jgi:pimeloyl-ACP methyl ester carboxylesterase
MRRLLVAVLLLTACTSGTDNTSPAGGGSPAGTGSAPPSTTSGAAAVFQDTVDIGGRGLFIQCEGSSPPGSPTVILEHGLGASHTVWLTVMHRLSDRVKVCSYDRAGRGLSDPAPPGPRTARDGADDLVALLTAAHLAPPYLFAAHSLGPWVTTIFVADHPGDVVGLVFVDPRGPGVSAAQAAAIPAPAPGEPESITGLREFFADPQRFSDNSERIAFGPSEAQVEAVFSTPGPAYGDIPVTVLAAEFTHLEWADQPEPIREGWDAAWRDGQQAYVAEAGDGHLVDVPHVGHDLPTAQPDAVVEAILAILDA